MEARSPMPPETPASEPRRCGEAASSRRTLSEAKDGHLRKPLISFRMSLSMSRRDVHAMAGTPNDDGAAKNPGVDRANVAASLLRGRITETDSRSSNRFPFAPPRGARRLRCQESLPHPSLRNAAPSDVGNHGLDSSWTV